MAAAPAFMVIEPGRLISANVNLNISPGRRRQRNPISIKTANIHHRARASRLEFRPLALARPTSMTQIPTGIGGLRRLARGLFPCSQRAPGFHQLPAQARLKRLARKSCVLGCPQGPPISCGMLCNNEAVQAVVQQLRPGQHAYKRELDDMPEKLLEGEKRTRQAMTIGLGVTRQAYFDTRHSSSSHVSNTRIRHAETTHHNLKNY